MLDAALGTGATNLSHVSGVLRLTVVVSELHHCLRKHDPKMKATATYMCARRHLTSAHAWSQRSTLMRQILNVFVIHLRKRAFITEKPS